MLPRSFSSETVLLDDGGEVLDRRTVEVRGFAEEVGGVELDMIEIPSGRCAMGSPEEERPRIEEALSRYVPQPRLAEWSSRQTPQHEIAVSGFALGRVLVSQKQWNAVANLPPVACELRAHCGRFDFEVLPQETITWLEATEFCARLARETGRPYRLPTEGEWEYACRARTTTEFWTGNTMTSDFVNYDGNYPYRLGRPDVYRQMPLISGDLGVTNLFGLADMHGNFWEWCQDVWHRSYEGAPADGSPWEDGGVGHCRVVRGGSWRIGGVECRSASRDRIDHRRGNEYVGLRVAMSL